MIRLGLCCIFVEEPIKFKTTTATYILKKPKKEILSHLSNIIFHNANSLFQALNFCLINQIGSFRITSRFFPLFTHPNCNYLIEDLPEANEIFSLLQQSKQLAKKKNIRLTFHPDPFVVLNSIHSSVVKQSLEEIEYHAYLSDLVGADVINIHAGGVYGDKKKSLNRLKTNLGLLSSSARKKITLENEEKSYTPKDLLPFCLDEKIPLVYDVHHHRCNPDGNSIDQTTKEAIQTWDREPLFHLSSPILGWNEPHPERHSDYINPKDFPENWYKIQNLTVEVEAKAKELAVLQLKQDLEKKHIPLWLPR